MKDIDFDELDKAVSSLMGPVEVPSRTGRSAPVEPPTRQPISTPKDPSASAVNESQQNDAPASSDDVKTVPRSSVDLQTPQTVRKSSGRFMDVVHPSSDMRSSSPVKTTSRSSGITPPTRSATVAVTPAPQSTAEPEPSEQDISSFVSEKAADTLAFPDPLDMIPQVEIEKESSPIVEDTDEEASVSGTDEITLTNELSQASAAPEESNEPLESLFLPNVKVEKRPLGLSGSPEASLNEDETKTETEPTSNFDLSDEKEDEDKKDTDTLVISDPALAELGEDVLAIESDTSVSEAKEQSQPEPATSSDTSAFIGTSSALASSAISSSIPRQYNVKPSTDDKHHEALYDAAAQTGAPLAHPAEKKSGWMVVLWILLLIVVGVGGALALYFLNVF